MVMPVYNGAQFLDESIASVRAQSHVDWELIVVDDCSADESVSIARGLAQADPRIKVLRMPTNAGSSAARNAGLTQRAGTYVAFLDADDIWSPLKLERQLDFMRKAGATFCFTAYRKLGAGGPGGLIGARHRVSWEDMLKGNRIGCSTVMLDARVHGNIVFPTGLGRQEDYALWLSLLRGGALAYGLDEPLVLYRVHESSKSARKLPSIVAQWRVYRDFEKLPALRAAWYLGHYAVRGVLKTLR